MVSTYYILCISWIIKCLTLKICFAGDVVVPYIVVGEMGTTVPKHLQQVCQKLLNM